MILQNTHAFFKRSGQALLLAACFVVCTFFLISRVGAEESLLFQDSFDTLATGNISGQNGWVGTGAGGNWQVQTGGQGQDVRESTGGFFSLTALTQKTVTGQSVRMTADFKGGGSPQLWVRRSGTGSNAQGYLFLLYGGKFYFDHVAGSNAVVLGTGPSISLTAGTWYTAEVEITNSATGVPTMKGWVYPQGTTRPATPYLTATDTSKRIAGTGYMALGTFQAATEFDNVKMYTLAGGSSSSAASSVVSSAVSSAPVSSATSSVVSSVASSTPASSAVSSTPASSVASSTQASSVASSAPASSAASSAASLPEGMLFQDDFNARTIGALSGQNGWRGTGAGGNWQVQTGGQGQDVRESTGGFYSLTAMTQTSFTAQDVRFLADFKGGGSPQLWLRRSGTGSNAQGYLFLLYGGQFYFDYVSGSNAVALANGPSANLTSGTWYTAEVEITNSATGTPTMKAWIYPQGTTRPTTPYVTATDSLKRLTGAGYIGLGSYQAAAEFDNVKVYGIGVSAPSSSSSSSTRNVTITFPQRQVATASGTATIGILRSECSTTFYVPYIQTASSITTTADAANVPTGGGVSFVLTNTQGTAQTQVDMSAPYAATFSGLAKDEYTLDTYMVDASQTVVAGATNHDRATRIGVGDIIVAIGDSVTEGYDGTAYNVPPYTNWLAAPVRSTDSRNYPQCGLSSGYYQDHWQERSHHIEINNRLQQNLGYPVFVLNEGFAGITSAGYVTKVSQPVWQNVMTALKPNKWIIHLGINDGAGSTTFQNNIQSLINTLTGTYGATGQDIALAVPAVGSNWHTYIQALITNNNLIAGPDFKTFYANHTNPVLYSGVHPNVAGHAEMGRLWALSLLRPTGLTAASPVGSSGSVLLNWNALSAVEPTIAGYKVHYGTTSGTYSTVIDVGNVTTKTVTGLIPNQTYYVTVSAYDNDAYVKNETRKAQAVSVLVKQ